MKDTTSKAAAVEETAHAFAAAVKEFTEDIDAYRTEAYSQGGVSGVTDVDAHASVSRVEDEIAGLCVGLGLAKVFRRDTSAVRPVSDFATRWEQRVENGVLVTSRTRPVAAT